MTRSNDRTEPSRLATIDAAMNDVDDRTEHHRRHQYDALHAASRDYDQAILTLAAASLALSVPFAHDITPTPVVVGSITPGSPSA